MTINIRCWLLAPLAVAALGMAATPAAHANTADENYLNNLAANGITGEPGQLIAVGHTACDNASNGPGVGGLATMFNVMGSLQVAPQQAYEVFAAANRAYCPQVHLLPVPPNF